MQAFGWYVNQSFFRLGIRPVSLAPLAGVCPDEIGAKIAALRRVENQHQEERGRLMALVEGESRSDITSDEPTYWQNVKLGEEKQYVTLRRHAGRLRQAVVNEVESITRKEFGFRAVGDGWISESMLFNLVKGLFPTDEILRHHRPEWLNGLELDIFLPERRLGIEYQGQQHFRAVSAWGGEGALKAVQERDAKKARLCVLHEVRLVTVDYTEPLNLDHIKTRVSERSRT